MKISFIIPTMGRDSLGKTLRSIELWKGDEILVEVDSPPSGRWGNDQRNLAMKRAKGDYLAFMDDDDVFVKGHRDIMEKAMLQNSGRPSLFRIKYPDGRIVWEKAEIVPGNISTQMILVPNNSKMLSGWKDGRNMADFIFVDNWGWLDSEISWRREIICLMGNDKPNYAK